MFFLEPNFYFSVVVFLVYCLNEEEVTIRLMMSTVLQYLEKELGIEALRTMKSIKGALDPNNIMNPGKIIPPHVCF